MGVLQKIFYHIPTMATIATASEDDEQCEPEASRMLLKREEIKALYGRYESQKLSDIPKLITKYGEDALLMMVRKKFRKEEATNKFPVHNAIMPNGAPAQPRKLAAAGRKVSLGSEIDVTMGGEDD